MTPDRLRLALHYLGQTRAPADVQTAVAALVEAEIARQVLPTVLTPLQPCHWRVDVPGREPVALDFSAAGNTRQEAGARLLALCIAPGVRYGSGEPVPTYLFPGGGWRGPNALRNARGVFANHVERLGLRDLAREARRVRITMTGGIEFDPSCRVAVQDACAARVQP